MALPEDHDDPDEHAVGPLLPPEDRLWRHPSELRSHPIAPITATTAPPRSGTNAGMRTALATAACVAGVMLVTGALWITWPRQSPELAGPGTPETPVDQTPTTDHERTLTATNTTVRMLDLFAPAAPAGAAPAIPAPAPARLGVQVIDFRPLASSRFPTVGAAEVVVVEAASAAERIGLRPGDLILAVGSHRIDSAADLVDVVSRHAPGDEVEVSVARPGDGHAVETHTATVLLGA